MKDIKYLKENNVDINSSLELLGDIETYNEMLQDFRNGLKGKLEQITKYFNDQDMPNYAIYVHSLKSDCKYFGFMKLAEIAYEHEVKSKDNDYPYIKNHINELMEEASKVQGIVEEYLSNEDSTKDTYNNLETLPSGMPEDIILVSDDSEVVRLFVKKIFDKDYDILVAKDGEETLNIIKEHEEDNKIKAILLDLNMPKISGFEVLEYMKENNLFNKMPVAIISGDSSSDAIKKAFNYPIVDMINKPFNESKIKDVVNKTIEKAG